MPHSIKLNNEELIIPFEMEDILEEIEKYMGYEARRYIEDWKASVDGEREYDALERAEAEKTLEKIQDHNRAVFVDLKLEAEALDELLDADRMNRKSLREVVRRMGRMINSEL